MTPLHKRPVVGIRCLRLAVFYIRAHSTGSTRRARIAHRSLKSVSSPQQSLEKPLSPDFDFPYTNTLILEDPAVAGRTAVAGAGTARILEYQNQRVLCEVESGSQGYLVLLDSCYPGLACVLGRDRGSRYWLPIMPSGRLKCGPVNIGSSSRPRSFYAGLSVTCLAIAFGTVVVFRGRDVVRVRDEAESDDRQ